MYKQIDRCEDERQNMSLRETFATTLSETAGTRRDLSRDA